MATRLKYLTPNPLKKWLLMLPDIVIGMLVLEVKLFLLCSGDKWILPVRLLVFQCLILYYIGVTVFLVDNFLQLQTNVLSFSLNILL